jgi:glycosyltransferase involved in cell wall biosynthesis
LEHGVNQVTVIPNGTDTPPLPELEAKPLTQPLQLIAVSRLAPNKRVDHAIELLRILVARSTPAQLTIVGTGESESGLRQSVQELQLQGQVTFTGKLSEQGKNNELKKAHFLVHTSVREGWGLNVIEANALGTPAIVYPVAGLVDSTVHDSTGIVTADETPASLANDLLKTLSTPGKYDRLRLNAWERSKTFQWDHVLPLACDWLEKQAAPKP